MEFPRHLLKSGFMVALYSISSVRDDAIFLSEHDYGVTRLIYMTRKFGSIDDRLVDQGIIVQFK